MVDAFNNFFDGRVLKAKETDRLSTFREARPGVSVLTKATRMFNNAFGSEFNKKAFDKKDESYWPPEITRATLVNWQAKQDEVLKLKNSLEGTENEMTNREVYEAMYKDFVDIPDIEGESDEEAEAEAEEGEEEEL